MEEEIFELSDSEYEQLNSKYPHGKGSGLIGCRSEEIIKFYFRRKYPDCEFSKPKNGADLEVIDSPNSFSCLLEVKGTADSRIAWQKLKVSSKHSHRMLTEEKIPLYRVTSVFDQNICIYILKHEEDFILEPEPRWSIKKKIDDIKVKNVNKKNDSIGRGRIMGHRYLLTLHKTYYDKGFFNLGVSVSDCIRDDEGDISIFLDSDIYKLQGRVNRNANTNGTPRIMVGVELINWFYKNCDLGEIVTVEVLSPDVIKIIKE